jgi:hypothetical protein
MVNLIGRGQLRFLNVKYLAFYLTIIDQSIRKHIDRRAGCWRLHLFIPSTLGWVAHRQG